MMQAVLAYQPAFDIFLLNCGFALSQYIVLRAGVFSIATGGFASIGAYCVAITVQRTGLPAPLAITAATLLGAATAAVLSLPLARLRGAYQAIATLAFVEILVSIAYYADNLTGGAMGINNIPKLMTTWQLALCLAIVVYLMVALDRSGIGRAFDAVRQDETVAATLGVSVVRVHTLAFVISGAVAGWFGGLQSLYVYSIEPEQFGFAFLTNVLAFVVLGGRGLVVGPIVGTAILAALPELARPLAENRPLLNGALLILIILYLPRGVADSVALHLRQARAARAGRAERASGAVPSA